MNNQTLLYRVISSAMWVQEGQVSSQAFRPRTSDNKLLSVYDGDQITPQEACALIDDNVRIDYGKLRHLLTVGRRLTATSTCCAT